MRYEILHKLGSGSSSVIYLARKVNCDDVAEDDCKISVFKSTKTIPKNGLDCSDTEKREVIVKQRKNSYEAYEEALLLRSLCGHPCIVQFIDAFLVKDIDKICIVMERAKSDLQQVLQRHMETNEPIDALTANTWLCQATLGLAHLHSYGLVHRDVKPANLLILSDGRMVVSDFGISRQCANSNLTTQIGTPYYLAPEVFSGLAYGAKADVWSLGCVAFELATSGRTRAFSAWDLKRLCNKVVRGDINWSALPDPCDIDVGFLRACLSVDTESRPTCTEILHHPFLVRALGAWIASWRAGRYTLSRAASQMLKAQLRDIGLGETFLAALHLGQEIRYRPQEA